MRLIDADELIPSLKMGEVNADTAYGDGRNGGIYFAIWRIEQMPTIEERKKGKWIVEGEFIDCSVCRREKWSRIPYENLVKRFRFCPNCGADMRGEKDEAD